MRYDGVNTISPYSAGSTPQWTTFDFNFDHYNSDVNPTIRIGLKGRLAAQDFDFSCGKLDYDPTNDIKQNINCGKARWATTVTLSSAMVTTPDGGSFIFVTKLTLDCNFVDPNAQASAPQLHDQQSIGTILGYPSAAPAERTTATISPTSEHRLLRDDDGNNVSSSQPTPYIETPHPTISSGPLSDITLEPSNEDVHFGLLNQSLPLNYATNPIAQPNPDIIGVYSKADASGHIDLHFPIAPCAYMGMKRQATRTLPNDNKRGGSSNPEKGLESDPTQLMFAEKAVMPNLTPGYIDSLRNRELKAMFGPTTQRYPRDELSAQWFDQYPHAWAGSPSQIKFYFSAPDLQSEIPSILLGIEQIWDVTNPITSQGPIVLAYGYTQTTIDEEYHGAFPLQPTVCVKTLHIPAEDYIAKVNVFSSFRFGIVGIRFITACGLDSGLILHRGGVSCQQMNDETIISNVLAPLKGFENSTIQLDLPDLTHCPGALAYFSVYYRPFQADQTLNNSLTRNSNGAPITSIIGALRPWASHPIKMEEINKTSPAVPFQDGKTVTSATPASTYDYVAEYEQNNNNTSGLAPLEIDVQDTQATTAATTQSAQASGGNNISVGAQVQTITSRVCNSNRDAFEGFSFAVVTNFCLFLVFGIVMAILSAEVAHRASGPTTCNTYSGKANFLFVPAIFCLLYALFLFLLFTYSWISIKTGCAHLDQRTILLWHHWVTGLWFLVQIVFCSVGLAFVFQIKSFCITMGERWTLFSLYLFILISVITILISLPVTKDCTHFWFNSVISQWLVVLGGVSIVGVFPIMLAFEKNRSGCCKGY